MVYGLAGRLYIIYFRFANTLKIMMLLRFLTLETVKVTLFISMILSKE